MEPRRATSIFFKTERPSPHVRHTDVSRSGMWRPIIPLVVASTSHQADSTEILDLALLNQVRTSHSAEGQWTRCLGRKPAQITGDLIGS